MTDKILIDRSVVEQALEAFQFYNPTLRNIAIKELRAALEQKCPCGATNQSQIDECAYANCAALEQPQSLPSPIWRLVPTTMTNAMAQEDQKLRHAVPWIRWEAILAAAPQPPVVEQPQVEQQPFTVLVRKRSWLDNQWEAAPCGFPDYGKQWADERINVYTNPQPPREPLTDEQIDDLLENVIGSLPVARKLIHAVERAHGIGGEK